MLELRLSGDSFTDLVRRLEREGRAGSYIPRFKKIINPWLAYNGLNVKLKVNVRGESDTLQYWVK